MRLVSGGLTPGSLLRRAWEQPYLLLTLTSLFWAGNAVVGRAVAGAIPPVALNQTRWTIAFLIMLPFAWPGIRAALPLIRRRLWLLALLAFLGISAFNSLLYWSLHFTTAINASLMQSSGPLLIGLWGYVLFRESLSAGQVAGVFVSLAGVLVIISDGQLGRLAALSLNFGDVLVLVAMALYALYSTLLRKQPGIPSLAFATLMMGLGALILAPFTLAEHLAGARFAPLAPGAVAALVYVVLFPSILALLCFNRGVQLIGSNRAGPFFHLIPLFGAALAVFFLGERPGLHHGLGAALVIGGVLAASRRRAGEARNRVAPDRDAR